MAHSSGYDSKGYPTANMAPGIIKSGVQVDSSKEGTVKEWSYERGYNQRPLAKNKAPEAPGAADFGFAGPFFTV